MSAATEDQLSYDAMLKALRRLKQVRKLEGTVVLKEGKCLSSDTLLGEHQVRDFVLQINALVSQYRNSGSSLRRALFHHDGGSFILFHLAPYVFCMFFGHAEEAADVEKACEEYLEEWSDSLKLEDDRSVSLPELKIEVDTPKLEKDVKSEDSRSLPAERSGNSAPFVKSLSPIDSDRDTQFKEAVLKLYSTVLGSGCAAGMLEPDWKAIKAIPYDSRKAPPEIEFGQALLPAIRDRRVRNKIKRELSDLSERYFAPERGMGRR